MHKIKEIQTSSFYETHGRVDPPSALRGRRRILSGEVIGELRELLQESPELYLDEIGEWLALYHEIHPRQSTRPWYLKENHGSWCSRTRRHSCAPSGCTTLFKTPQSSTGQEFPKRL